MKALKKSALIAAKILILVAVCALAALPALFMNTAWGYLPILVVLVLLIFDLALPFLVKRSVTVEISGPGSEAAKELECARGSRVEIGLKIRNKSILTSPAGTADVYISDLFGGRAVTNTMHFMLSAKGTLDLGFQMEMKHVGVCTVGLENIHLKDFFGLFSVAVKAGGCYSVLVTPRIRPVDEFIISEETTAESNTDTRTTAVGGTDYTGIRAYVPGDPMKQIHWKMSAHTREYVTKLQESSRHQEYSVILDMASQPLPEKKGLMECSDCLIETALSLADEISRHDAGCSLLYADRDNQVVRTGAVRYDDYPELVRSLAPIQPEPAGEFPDGASVLQEEGRMHNRSTNTLIVTSRLTSELLDQVLAVRRRPGYPEIYFIIPAAMNSREREQLALQFRPLEDAGVPWFFVSTAANFAASESKEAAK